MKGDTWLSKNMLSFLARTKGAVTVKDAGGRALAWMGKSSSPASGATCRSADEWSFAIRFPWDLLRVNEILVGELVESKIRGEVSPAAHIDGRLVLGKGSRVLAGVFVDGNVVVGANCKIGPNCYIRGNTSIGDGCHVGHAVEIKNCLVMAGTSIGHLSYCGDSVIGERVNLGAGTITANFRHDGQNHRSMVGGELVDTGRRKFGAVLGDNVHTGIHTSIYPGRKMWPGTATIPGAVVGRDILS